MKEHTESINDNLFIPFQSSHIRENHVSLLFVSLKQRTLALKDHLLNAVAALGIGAIFLLTVYLFCIQLAEYGWQ